MLCIYMVLSGCVAGMIYHPSGKIETTPAHIGLAYEWVRVETADGVEISGWWVPAADAKKTVLFFHGNAGNIGSRLDTIRMINSLGLHLFIIDYRGFGKSSGAPSEKGLYLDAEAALDYLVDVRNIDAGALILWGRSLGGAVAARTAAEREAGKLILESTFTSMAEAANDLYSWVPGGLLANHSYPTAAYLPQIDIPTLVIHSKDDEVIGFHHGRQLFDAISAPKGFVEIQGSHNQGWIASEDVYVEGVRVFIGDVKKQLSSSQYRAQRTNTTEMPE